MESRQQGAEFHRDRALAASWQPPCPGKAVLMRSLVPPALVMPDGVPLRSRLSGKSRKDASWRWHPGPLTSAAASPCTPSVLLKCPVPASAKVPLRHEPRSSGLCRELRTALSHEPQSTARGCGKEPSSVRSPRKGKVPVLPAASPGSRGRACRGELLTALRTGPALARS